MIDGQTMIIISSVGIAGSTVGGILWGAVMKLHKSTVSALNAQNKTLAKRTEECEEDRKLLHGRLNDQGEKINEMNLKLGRLEGRLGKE